MAVQLLNDIFLQNEDISILAVNLKLCHFFFFIYIVFVNSFISCQPQCFADLFMQTNDAMSFS